MKHPRYEIVLLALAALFCTGGTFTCESKKKDSTNTNAASPGMRLSVGAICGGAVRVN